MSVYLAPLIDELQDIWRGVQFVEDSRTGRRKFFNLKGMVMWTMHDYPGYGNVSMYRVQDTMHAPHAV